MKKEIKTKVEAFYKENGIDFVSLPIIVAHYISIGEQAASQLDPFRVEDVYRQEVAKQQEAEEEGKICIITPEFTKFILTACYHLYLLPKDVKRAILIEGLK